VISRKRVARQMRLLGLQGAHHRRHRSKGGPRPLHALPDLVSRSFTAAGPDRLWVADITYWPTGEGWLDLAVVIDAFSRRCVGWAMAPHLRTELVADALEMATTRRRPSPGLVHHSDQGTQYTSFAFGTRLREAGIAGSVGRVGDAYDNAVAEAFFATLKRELLRTRRFATRAEASAAIFEWIEVFYNRQRRHTTIGGVSPAEFERSYAAATST
jgi:putative transposase